MSEEITQTEINEKAAKATPQNAAPEENKESKETEITNQNLTETAGTDMNTVNTASSDTVQKGSDLHKKILREHISFDEDEEFSRDEWILSHLRDEDLLEYLAMEQKKSEMAQEAKERKEKQIIALIQTIAFMAAVVAVVGFLKDNPVVLVNILYILGIAIVLWIWRNPKDR